MVSNPSKINSKMTHPKANTSLKAIAIGLAMAFAACKEKPTDPDLLYDRAALAEQIANELVQPGYDSLATRLDGLGQATATFSTQLDSASLLAAQTALRNAWEQWNRVSAFEFGPGATHALRQTMNTFPCDANQVNQNVLAGTWDLNTATNIDARGFPALDYLLHGLGATQSEIIAAYTTAANATQRKAYLLAVVDDLKIQHCHRANGMGFLFGELQGFGGHRCRKRHEPVPQPAQL
jgi:predicted lipoprotein